MQNVQKYIYSKPPTYNTSPIVATITDLNSHALIEKWTASRSEATTIK